MGEMTTAIDAYKDNSNNGAELRRILTGKDSQIEVPIPTYKRTLTEKQSQSSA